MKQKLFNYLKLRHFLYLLLAAGFLVGCSNDGEFGKSVVAFLDSPLTEMSVGDLVILLVVVGFIFK